MLNRRSECSALGFDASRDVGPWLVFRSDLGAVSPETFISVMVLPCFRGRPVVDQRLWGARRRRGPESVESS